MLHIRHFLVLSLLLFLSTRVNSKESQVVYYCNWDTGKVDKGIIKKLVTMPAIDSQRDSIELQSGLVIRQSEVIQKDFIKVINCI